MKKIVIYAILLCIISLVAIYFLSFQTGGIKWSYILNFLIKNWWGSVGIVSLVTSWFADSGIVYLLARSSSSRSLSFWSSFKASMIGKFFSMITPSYTGGQPAQIMYMKRHGMTIGASTSIVVLKYIIEQTSIVVLAVLGIERSFGLLGKVAFAIPLGMLGFVLSSGGVAFFLLFTINQKIRTKIFSIAKWIVSLLEFKKELVPKMEKVIERMDLGLKDYMDSFKLFVVDLKLMGLVFGLGFISILAKIFIAYTVISPVMNYQGNVSDFLNVVAIQSLAMMVIFLVPTPGASGAAEGGFYLFFSSIVPSVHLATVTIEWRILSYFFPLFFSLIIVILESIHMAHASG